MELAKFYTIVANKFQEHGLHNAGWRFRVNTRKSALGVCHYLTKTIELQRFHILNDSEESVVDTLLHEIAHALTPGAKHSWTFKQKAYSIGCKSATCKSSNELVARPLGRYAFPCLKCGHKHSWNRRPKHSHYICKKNNCGGRIQVRAAPTINNSLTQNKATGLAVFFPSNIPHMIEHKCECGVVFIKPHYDAHTDCGKCRQIDELRKAALQS